MSRVYLTLLFILTSFWGISQSAENSLPTASIGIVGSPEDVSGKTEAGYTLAGGGKDQDAAMKWMIARAGGGDFVIIRAGGSTGYNNYLYEMGGLNSVETLLIDSREKAMSRKVGERIREAEGLFIAGGDQWNYVKFWKDSEVSSALQYLIDVKKVPIGGTSAGCAVLSGIIFDARNDTVVSADALANPYASQVSISKSFIQLPFLATTIADQHYSQRDRLGRHVAFMARMTKDFSISQPKGIAADERTAVCIDKDGNAVVIGEGNAFFIISNKSLPEVCEKDQPLTWTNKSKALRVYIFKGSTDGTAAFNVTHWPTKKPTEYWFVRSAELFRMPN